MHRALFKDVRRAQDTEVVGYLFHKHMGVDEHQFKEVKHKYIMLNCSTSCWIKKYRKLTTLRSQKNSYLSETESGEIQTCTRSKNKIWNRSKYYNHWDLKCIKISLITVDTNWYRQTFWSVTAIPMMACKVRSLCIEILRLKLWHMHVVSTSLYFMKPSEYTYNTSFWFLGVWSGEWVVLI